jgi:hypothetical protein
MKKFLLKLGLSMLMLLTASVVYAEQPAPAIVVHDEWCVAPDAEFNLYEFEDCCTMVDTNSATDVQQFNCHAQLPDGAVIPEKAVRFTYKNSGFMCFWDFEGPFTTNYIFTITPSGAVNMSCRFTPGSVFPDPE